MEDSIFIIYMLFVVALVAFLLVTQWIVFTKAGRAGWESIVPIYNAYVLCKIAKISPFWLFAAFIPYVNFIFSIIVYYNLGKAFNKSTGFCIGLILLTPIFLAILAFGDEKYLED